MTIENNTTKLQNLLSQVNSLPDAGSGGVELPDLTTPGTAADLLSGKQLIDEEGNVVTGTHVCPAGEDRSVDLIEGNFTSWEDNEVTTLRPYAFAGCSSLASVSFPAVSYIGSSAFYSCRNLTSVSFPMATSMGMSTFCSCGKLTSVSFPAVTHIFNCAFQSCGNLTTVNFPVATETGYGAFYACSNLTSVNFPVATEIGSSAFAGCVKLTSVNIPMATIIYSTAFARCSSLVSVSFPLVSFIGSSAFSGCSNLISVSFPLVSRIERSAFAGCSSLASVSFPAVSYIGSSAFASCVKLTSLSFPVASYIASYAFRGCTNLISLYLLASSCCGFEGSAAFGSTGITKSTGYIYVPSSLVDSYKGAARWSYFSDRIFGYEGSGDSSSTTIITFTINSIEYQAEEGMTWGEWCSSAYNIDGFNDNGVIVDQIGIGVVVDETGMDVSSSDVIVNGLAYSY